MQYKQLINDTLKDRPYIATIIAVIIVALIGIVFVSFNVEARDIQVATRYSSFGDANYYKDKWYSLYEFPLLFAAIAVGHSMLMLKFRALERRNFGVLFGLGTIIVLIIGIVYAMNIINQIAFI